MIHVIHLRSNNMKIRDISITVRTLGQQRCYLTVTLAELVRSLACVFFLGGYGIVRLSGQRGESHFFVVGF